MANEVGKNDLDFKIGVQGPSKSELQSVAQEFRKTADEIKKSLDSIDGGGSSGGGGDAGGGGEGAAPGAGGSGGGQAGGIRGLLGSLRTMGGVFAAVFSVGKIKQTIEEVARLRLEVEQLTFQLSQAGVASAAAMKQIATDAEKGAVSRLTGVPMSMLDAPSQGPAQEALRAKLLSDNAALLEKYNNQIMGGSGVFGLDNPFSVTAKETSNANYVLARLLGALSGGGELGPGRYEQENALSAMRWQAEIYNREAARAGGADAINRVVDLNGKR